MKRSVTRFVDLCRRASIVVLLSAVVGVVGGLAGVEPASAADLVVPSGQIVALPAGAHEYSKAIIQGQLVLQGNTSITLTYCRDNPDQCVDHVPVLDLSGGNGTIRYDKKYGEKGADGVNPGDSGSNGGDGGNAPNLTIIVYGDAVLSTYHAGYTIDLTGGNGGGGGKGVSGAPGVDAHCRNCDGVGESSSATDGGSGGHGGSGANGGNGGDLKLIVYGDLTGGQIDVQGGGAGSGGAGGSGAKGGRSCVTGYPGVEHEDECNFIDAYDGGNPGLSARGGDGAQPGKTGSVVILANNVTDTQVYAEGTSGGSGGAGGSGADGSMGSADDGWDPVLCSKSSSPTPGAMGGAAKVGVSGGSVFINASCSVENVSVSASAAIGASSSVGDNGDAGYMSCIGKDYPCDATARGLEGLVGGAGLPGAPGGKVVILADEVSSAGSVGIRVNGERGGAAGDGGDSGWGCHESFDDHLRGQAFRGGDGGNGGDGGRMLIKARSISRVYPPEISWGEGVMGGSGGCCNWDSTQGKYVPAGGASKGADGAPAVYDMITVDANGLRVMTAVNKAQAKPGSPIEYTVSVSGAQAHSNVKLTFSVPENVTPRKISGHYTQSDGNIVWTIPDLAPCRFAAFTVKGVISGEALAGDIIKASAAAVSTQTPQPVESNTVETLIEGKPVPPAPMRLKNKLGPSQDVPYVSDPVNPAIGNYVFSRELFRFPGKGLPLVFTVAYNSRDTDHGGPLGTGLDTHLQRRTVR